MPFVDHVYVYIIEVLSIFERKDLKKKSLFMGMA